MILLFTCLFLLIGQPATPVCPTAAWNQTFTVRAGSSGNAGATSTTLNQPHNIDIDIYGNLFVADCTNHRIQKFLPGREEKKTFVIQRMILFSIKVLCSAEQSPVLLVVMVLVYLN